MGSHTLNSVRPGALVTITEPPCAVTTAWTIESPSPVLPLSRVKQDDVVNT